MITIRTEYNLLITILTVASCFLIERAFSKQRGSLQ